MSLYYLVQKATEMGSESDRDGFRKRQRWLLFAICPLMTDWTNVARVNINQANILKAADNTLLQSFSL
ncbi:MAG: hypothetical protein PSN37_01610 [Alphaproteobacteria bacterium]|nr:hypothetical protein [Alphaproteobacteria bacterium]